MFMRDLKRRLGRLIGPLGALFLAIYFSYHLLNGDRALLVWRDLEKRVGEASSQLDEISVNHDRLERRVKLLRSHVCPSLLEEEMRRLGYAHQDEVVVYR